MKNIFKCLFLCGYLSVQCVYGQIIPIEKKILKYSSSASKGLQKGESDFYLVRIKSAPAAVELLKIKFLRRLSADVFILSKDNLNENLQNIDYKIPANAMWKASDLLFNTWQSDPENKKEVTIRLLLRNSISALPEFLNPYQIVSRDDQHRLILISLPIAGIERLLAKQEIQFADIPQTAREEIVVNSLDLSGMDVLASRHFYPGLDGAGRVLSLKEGQYSKDDLDLLGKTVADHSNTSADNGHAVTMATLALGSGNSFIRGMGVAPAAKLSSSDFKNLMPDAVSVFQADHSSLQNHSYGVGIENFYGIEAAAYDEQVFETDTLIHVFSAGNRGSSSADAGTYQKLSNWANLTGNFKQAKNVLVVGGINVNNVSEALSSKGPAFDGRIKPEVVAPGEDGTSGSAALTSGVILLMQQAYVNKFNKNPSAALIKSILVNSADDLGTAQVDYIYGFGKVNALNALLTLNENRFRKGAVMQDQDFSFPVQIGSSGQLFKVSLAWNDPAAPVNSVNSLINHLDLSVETPSGEVILPWVLNAVPNADSLALQAVRKVDELNNVQQVTLDHLQPGNYIIHVKGRAVMSRSQEFYISYQVEEGNTFKWTYPGEGDAVFANATNAVRWQNGFRAGTGKLSVSYDGGTNWVTVQPSVDLKANFLRWEVDNRFTKALLKMEIAGSTYMTQPFIISGIPELKVGYSCDDGLLFHWKPQMSAKDYSIYTIEDQKLVLIEKTTDSLIFIPKSKVKSPYFALSANGNNFTGLKSYTLDFQSQGLSCYVLNFLGNAVDNGIKLELNIGTTYNLKSIRWEKQTASDQFTAIKQEQVMDGFLSYNLMDNNPRKGIQRYRAAFVTMDGRTIFSDVISVNYLKNGEYTIYPNPVRTDLNVLNGSFEDYTLTLFNISGQKVMEEKGNGQAKFDVSRLVPGVYISVISKNGVSIEKYKVIKL